MRARVSGQHSELQDSQEYIDDGGGREGRKGGERGEGEEKDGREVGEGAGER